MKAFIKLTGEYSLVKRVTNDFKVDLDSSEHPSMTKIKQVQWIIWYVHKQVHYCHVTSQKGNEALIPAKALSVTTFQAEFLPQEFNYTQMLMHYNIHIQSVH